MTMPTYLPGVVSRPQVSMEQRVAELENRLSEFMRRDLSSAGIGLGGKLRVLYGSGAQAVLIGTDPADDKPKVIINDPAGNVIFATDSDAGYGMSFPETPVPMSAVPGLFFITDLAQRTIFTGSGSVLNPCFNMWAEIQVNGDGAAARTGAAQWKLEVPQASFTWTSAEQAIAAPAGTLLVAQVPNIAKQLPSNCVGKQINVTLSCRLLVAPSDASDVIARPLIAAGCSLAKAQSIGLVA